MANLTSKALCISDTADNSSRSLPIILRDAVLSFCPLYFMLFKCINGQSLSQNLSEDSNAIHECSLCICSVCSIVWGLQQAFKIGWRDASAVNSRLIMVSLKIKIESLGHEAGYLFISVVQYV